MNLISLKRNSEDVSVPYSFKKKASPWDAVHKWCKLHNVSTTELYKKVGLYEEFKEKMRLRKAELRKVAAEKNHVNKLLLINVRLIEKK